MNYSDRIVEMGVDLSPIPDQDIKIPATAQNALDWEAGLAVGL